MKTLENAKDEQDRELAQIRLENFRADEEERRAVISEQKLIERGWTLLESSIKKFEDCVAAGNPFMESNPRQCRTSDGKNFVEEIN